jgi:hypothetical protein
MSDRSVFIYLNFSKPIEVLVDSYLILLLD